MQKAYRAFSRCKVPLDYFMVDMSPKRFLFLLGNTITNPDDLKTFVNVNYSKVFITLGPREYELIAKKPFYTCSNDDKMRIAKEYQKLTSDSHVHVLQNETFEYDDYAIISTSFLDTNSKQFIFDSYQKYPRKMKYILTFSNPNRHHITHDLLTKRETMKIRNYDWICGVENSGLPDAFLSTNKYFYED